MIDFDIVFKGACNASNIRNVCEESETICEAMFQTKGATCNSQCQSMGLVCEDGWNDESGTCGRRDNDGCNSEKQGQICRCKSCKSTFSYSRFLTQ